MQRKWFDALLLVLVATGCAGGQEGQGQLDQRCACLLPGADGTRDQGGTSTDLVQARLEEAQATPMALHWLFLVSSSLDPQFSKPRAQPAGETQVTVSLASTLAPPDCEVATERTEAKAVERTQSAIRFISNPDEGCWRVRASLRLTTTDGWMDDTFVGQLVARSATLLEFTGQPLIGSPNIIGQHLPPPTDPSSLGPWVTVRFDELEVFGEISSPAGPIARFSSDYLPPQPWWPYAVPTALAATCRAGLADAASAPSTDRVPPGPGLEALQGTWLLCEGSSTAPTNHAGIAFAADGTWHHVAERAGALQELTGFGHEGYVENPSVYGRPSLRGLPLPLEQALLSLERGGALLKIEAAMGNDGEPVAGFTHTYVRTDLEVTAARPRRERGERAGEAGCIEREAHVLFPTEARETLDLLAGTWTYCGDALALDAKRISIDAGGAYEQLGVDGRTIENGRLSVIPGVAMHRIAFTDTTGRTIATIVGDPLLIFDAPRKVVWATYDSADERRLVTLSAMPE